MITVTTDSEFLRSSRIIDWEDPAVMAQASALRHADDPLQTARACFEWVRDEIQHSSDYQRGPVTCRASDALRHGTGFCYAKSHLLAALLRANGIAAGLCYQRLSVNGPGPPFCLHGFNAVKLPGIGWYRVDPRGNRHDVDAQFTPPVEQLAFSLSSPEEVEFENVFCEPLDCVVESLPPTASWDEVLAKLPDVDSPQFASLGLVVRRSGRGRSGSR